MASITQDMKFRLSLIRYAQKYGVTNAAIKYKTNRHTPQEIKLISDMRRRNPDAALSQAFPVFLKNRASWPSILLTQRYPETL